MALLHMHRERPQAMGWGRPNIVHSVKVKMSKAILKDGMIKQVENQTPKLRLAQDFNQVQ
jgi:hypothetical protein